MSERRDLFRRTIRCATAVRTILLWFFGENARARFDVPSCVCMRAGPPRAERAVSVRWSCVPHKSRAERKIRRCPNLNFPRMHTSRRRTRCLAIISYLYVYTRNRSLVRLSSICVCRLRLLSLRGRPPKNRANPPLLSFRHSDGCARSIELASLTRALSHAGAHAHTYIYTHTQK